MVDNCLVEAATGKLIYGNAFSIIPTDGSIKSIGDAAFAFAMGETKDTSRSGMGIRKKVTRSITI